MRRQPGHAAIAASLSLQFRTIDLARDAALCVQFRRDSYACSFPDPNRFDREIGADDQNYLDWLKLRIAEFSPGFVHLRRDGQIIGQMEMQPRGCPPIGYINLFYLIPAVRGTGVGKSLHAYALSVFGKLACQKLQLSVSPSNARAIAFYARHGWQDLGPRPGYNEVHLMELVLRACQDAENGNPAADGRG